MSEEKNTEDNSENQVGERKKRKNSTFTFEYGDFTYDLLSIKRFDQSMIKAKHIYEELALRAMEQHYAFYGQLNGVTKIEGYVTRNAIIHCDCGNADIRLDAYEDHGVIAANGEPVLTCDDCQANINIYRFGLCAAEEKYGKLSALRPSGEKEMNEEGIMCYRCMPVLAEKWKQKGSDLLIGDVDSDEFAEALKAGAYLTCRYGGQIYIIEPAEDKNTGELAEEAYQILRQWLLGGYKVISQEDLAVAMENLATYGNINTISSLNEPIIPKSKDDATDKEEVEIETLKRIRSCIETQDKYDVQMLAWINYWNMTMEKRYCEDFPRIRAEVIKAMALVESNIGKKNTELNITENPERDIMQSLDPRNPVIWIIVGRESNKYITIQRAENDVKSLKIEKEEQVKAYGEPLGSGQVNFFECGNYEAVKEIVSEDLQTYYAGKVTPELSLAIGVGVYCMNINGTKEKSLSRSETNAVGRYNGGGDKYYTYKVNLVLENMGVERLGE